MSVLIPNHYSATAALIYVSFSCPPAHWTCAFSPLWILWHRYHGTELKAVLAAHQKLGKIVRVGPREISISDFETGVAQVYNAGFEKPHYFDFFQYYGQLNSFASKTRADHAACRKRISPSYSKSTLFNSKSLPKIIHKIVYQRLVPVLQDHVKAGEPVQLLPLFYAASLDVLNCYILGIASGPNFTQDPDLTETWLRHYENRYAPQSFWLQEVPWLAQGLGRLGWDVMPRVHYTSTKWVEDWMLEHCDRAETVYQEMLRGEDVALEDVPVVYHQIRKSMSKLESENANFLAGAREVFGMVLSYAIYYIAQHPKQQARLQREVSRLGLHLSQQHGADDFPAAATPQAIESLSYLQAVINESLRMRPNSTPLPRITPKGKPVSISGVDDIPPGTRVNCFQWFLHRDPTLWPEPDKWMPERWLDEKTGLLKQAGELPPLWAFVTGPRSCVGAQLTYYSFGYMLASLFANFGVEVARPETYLRHSPGSLEDELHVTLQPVGGSDEKEVCY
ncbi:cytochrome P450 [Apiospora kogelbergensis]|uniref:cytochrome P450 n=1 Tax=Apiospora kogelbergensis TaxID=1337665 RepID=UPI003130B38C